jgi:hypothetical protein
MTDTPPTSTMPPEALGLVVELMRRNASNAAWTTNQLLDGYRADLATRTAELAAIRAGVSALLAGPWMPTSDAIRDALYPAAEVIDLYREGAS